MINSLARVDNALPTAFIYLHMVGAPSTLDLFDYKPKLVELNGKPCPDSYIRGQQFAFIKGTPKLLGSPHKFARHGKSGQLSGAWDGEWFEEDYCEGPG